MTAVDSTALTRAIPSPRAPVPGPVDLAVVNPATGPRAGALGRRVMRTVVWAGLVLSFALTCVRMGLPTDRVVLLGWVVAGLTLHAVVDGVRRVGRLLVDWLPLVALLLAYDASRGVADGLGRPCTSRSRRQRTAGSAAGPLPTVVLQQHWDAAWWEALAALVYGSHFVVTPLLLAVLWVRNRAHWARFARLVVALSAAGLVTYVLYPAAPPWLAARDGVIEPVRRLSGVGWEVLGLPRAGALLADSQGQVNQVAAVPSLHTAFAVLACLVLLPVATRSWQRVLLVAYPVLMAVVLVWAGEHYVVDTLLGAVYAVGVVGLPARLGPVLAQVGRRLSPVGRPAPMPGAVALASPTVDG